MKKFSILTAILVLSAFFLPILSGVSAVPALARQLPQSAPVIEVHPGLDGLCKFERWIPLRVTLQNNGPDIDGSLVAAFEAGQREWRYTSEVELPAVSRKEVTLFAFPPDRVDSVLIELWDGNDLLSVNEVGLTCLGQDDVIYGVWAASPSIFNTLTAVDPPGGRATLAQLQAADFPVHFQGFASLDTLAISDVDTGVLSPAQREALKLWIANGGRLIVAGGPGWQKTAAGLADLLPLDPSGTVTLDALPGIQAMANTQQPLEGQAVVATGAIDPEAFVLAADGSTPLVVEKQIGFGRVIYMAADPALSPLRNWDGMEDLYRRLLDTTVGPPAWTRGFTSWGDAGNALANIPGLSLPPIWLICGFLVLYVLMIGPVNYFVLRALKIREMAWVSIPVVTILFTGAAFLIGSQIRGNRPIVSQLSVVEVWPEMENALSHGLVGVFSPSRVDYRLQMEGGQVAHPIISQGVAGNITQDWQVVQRENGFLIPEMLVDVGGIQATVTSGSLPAPRITHSLAYEAGSGLGLGVRGQVTNQSALTLEDAYILAPSGAQHLGTLGPGESRLVNLSFVPNSGAIPLGVNPLNLAPAADTTLRDLFGTTSVYSLQEPTEIQRFHLVRSILLNGTRGNGIYLFAWSTQPLNPADLVSERPIRVYNTLYIVQLEASIGQMEGQISIPPSMFSWSVFEVPTVSGQVGAYDAYSNQGLGSYSLRFSLNQPFQYEEVLTLELNLESYGGQGAVPYEISLWDFTLEDWIQQEGLVWGTFQVPDPEKYVSAGAEIRLKIENRNPNDRIVIERSDFTLAVRR